MKRSKPVKSLVALFLAAGAAVAGWQGWKSWQRWTGRQKIALPPDIAQPPRPAVTVDASVPVAPPRTPAAQPAAAAEAEASEPATPANVAEDEVSALLTEVTSPETAQEIADLLPEPNLPLAGVGDETPLAADDATNKPAPPTASTKPSGSEPEPAPAADDGVDQVLEVLAAEADAREPSSVASRFGPNALAADEGGDCPPDHPVKGNANSMIFHLPGQSSYGATMAEVCFSDAAAAEAAGFRPRKR